jgi:hypothetical protein
MEDVLDVSTRSSDARLPQVCMDETCKQLLREPRPSQPPAPGGPRWVDSEYERGGVANLFLFCEPLAGRRWVEVTDHRYPDAERIRLVMDNLNTHSPVSLYEAFPPAEAKRLADKLEIHHTPRHGRWLNMAEIELSVLSGQCLNRRVPDFAALQVEIAAWQRRRDGPGTRITDHSGRD